MNVVLLAAGRGSRLAEFTERTHKSLLPIAGRPALQYLLDETMRCNPRDVVIVTGHRCDELDGFVRALYPRRIRSVFNERYESDTNILSTYLGVEALANPEAGYLVVETDVVMEPAGWHCVFHGESTRKSEWATGGCYCSDLTGGAVKADPEGEVEAIVYAPKYDARFDGWAKLLGVLYVGVNEVAADRRLRYEAI